MGERTEYWWILYKTEVQPAEVGFVGGIPATIWTIGSGESLPAASVELLARLPAAPTPIFKTPEPPPQPAKPERSGSYLWLVGILLLILVAQCSGSLFDAIK
jgi:hypothetical protein